MSARNVRIEITDLPSRARQLNPEEVRHVFGGCSGRNEYCQMTSDCCQIGGWANRLACLGTGPLWPLAGICG